MDRIFDLEDRTTIFGSAIIRYVDRMPNTLAGRHLGGQLIRSGTAPALHYGEAQSAESRRDFIHKVKLALKELRESRVNMRMIAGVRHHAKGRRPYMAADRMRRTDQDPGEERKNR